MPKVELIHAFQESDKKDKKAHVKYWFGMSPLDEDEFNPEDGSYIVCYCGARLEPLDAAFIDEASVAAVWHLKQFKETRE